MNPDSDFDHTLSGVESSVAKLPVKHPKKRRLLLVDLENLPNCSLAAVGEDTDVIVYVGAGQKTIPIDLVAEVQRFGDRLRWQRIGASGPNALDFFIACELGRQFETARNTECTVLSKDKGFDPLLKHLRALGMQCHRRETIGELHTVVSAPKGEPASTKTQVDEFSRVVRILRSSEKSRPKTRSTLTKHLTAMLQTKKDASDVDRLLLRLQREGLVVLDNDKVSYSL